MAEPSTRAKWRNRFGRRFQAARRKRCGPSQRIRRFEAAAEWEGPPPGALEEEALRAAVVAAIRHRHMKYDRLLMKGLGRMHAREAVRDDIDRVLERWRRAVS
jgi:hypothetical protein